MTSAEVPLFYQLYCSISSTAHENHATNCVQSVVWSDFRRLSGVMCRPRPTYTMLAPLPPHCSPAATDIFSSSRRRPYKSSTPPSVHPLCMLTWTLRSTDHGRTDATLCVPSCAYRPEGATIFSIWVGFTESGPLLVTSSANLVVSLLWLSSRHPTLGHEGLYLARPIVCRATLGPISS